MTTTTTRRRLLAGAAAVPLLPVAAQGANLQKVEPDPAVAAYERWLEAWKAERAYQSAVDRQDDPACLALQDATDEATWALIEAKATTPAGAFGKLILFLSVTGCADQASADPDDPESFDMGVTLRWYDGRDHECGRALLRDLREMQA